MLIILSAVWPEAEIEAVYGRLPVAFLPFGAEPYFQAQRQVLPGEPCVLAVPSDFASEAQHRLAHSADDIRLLPQPAGFTDCQMVANALRRVAADGPVHILLGGALVSLHRAVEDSGGFVAVMDGEATSKGLAFDPSAAAGTRFFARSPELSSRGMAVCGYFRITDPDRLARACDAPSLSGALNAYDRDLPFEPLPADEWLCIGSADSYARAKSRRLVSRGFKRHRRRTPRKGLPHGHAAVCWTVDGRLD